MDLRQMLNTDAGAAAAVSPTQPSKPPPPLARHPSTPIQSVPPHSFRDYSQTTQASPIRQPSHDGYGPPQQPLVQTPGGGPQPYASSPASYHPPPSVPTSYGAPRQAPPPMGPDARSPNMSAMPVAGSPYARRTPVGTPGGAGSGGYPFPPTAAHPAPNSPVQRHQYPPAGPYPQRSDSFSQPAPGPGPPPPMGSQQVGSSYMQGGPPLPQTPPVGTAGGPPPALHQRSQSTHSTPTPTSAHSQHQYGAPYSGSPVMSHHQPPPPPPPPPPPSSLHHQTQQPPTQPQQEYYSRQGSGSNPPTPIGPPLAPGPQRTSSNASYPPPSSPYQQRLPSAGSFPPPPPPQLHTSPQPAPAIIPKMPSSHHAGHDAEPQRRPQSRSERELSQSISPKTRNQSIQSSTGQPASTPTTANELETRQTPAPKVMPNPATGPMDLSRDRAVTPGKRKMDDRDLEPEDIARQEPRPAPFESRNGSRSDGVRSSASPTVQRKRPKRYTEVPTWALSIRSKDVQLKHPNFEVRSKAVHAPPHVNGKRELASRHASPEATRAHPAQGHPGPPAPPPNLGPSSTLGPWEPTITNKRPQEELYRVVADFLFLNVIQNEHRGEILSRNIQFEIEAKLGICINKDTNERFDLPVETECVLRPSHQIAFKSSMNEDQHRGFNQFLNEVVKSTHPHNPAAVGRVQIDYKHRREVDRFFEMPRDLEGRLPAVIRYYNHASGRRGIKVRVTYERREGRDGNMVLVPIRQIMKARISDLDIHFPRHSMDCRISVNLEMPWDGPMEEIEELGTSDPARMPDREKDRLSYSQGPYQIDLTQVTQKVIGLGNKPMVKKEHELEIELDADLVLKQGEMVLNRSSPHHYTELVEGMVDNVRLLVQKAGQVRHG